MTNCDSSFLLLMLQHWATSWSVWMLVFCSSKVPTYFACNPSPWACYFSSIYCIYELYGFGNQVILYLLSLSQELKFWQTFSFHCKSVINPINPIACHPISHHYFHFSTALLLGFIHSQHALGGFHYPIKLWLRDKTVSKLSLTPKHTHAHRLQALPMEATLLSGRA